MGVVAAAAEAAEASDVASTDDGGSLVVEAVLVAERLLVNEELETMLLNVVPRTIGPVAEGFRSPADPQIPYDGWQIGVS